MHWIATALGNGATDTAFTNIPQTFTHLQIRVTARSSQSAATDFLYMRCGTNGVNADFGTNYRFHSLIGDGASTASGAAGSATTYIEMPIVPAATATANLFGSTIIDILDYTNTSKFKVIRGLGGYDANGSGNVRLQSGLYMSTSAINLLVVATGNNFPTTGSRVDLYGITSNPATGA
jgi:hypothetical protein